ncbi:MAG: hypothetical protein JRN26_02450 [Nitrososphaerota archaeon]|jgi:hypothetical protein|nr:hypothetical protein [Nitrososphaerota archaeon]MDG6929626.1 hypothetical protein [Nitrososphaerota archaeon]MDG6932393.1 hypothetical protein [Nitrososphaerota archaeon]MDG6935736.1 hypothetical protein [Nitrososphaerota archaeon]MDG6944722.1 hypothetical protein [Nitrososphaerota archaeon]
MKVSAGTERKLPRKFSFPFGSGLVVEEASILCSTNGHSWEPTMQLLKMDNGEELVRFCVYRGKRLTGMPMIVDREQLMELGKQVAKNKRLESFIRVALKQP